MYEVQKTSWEIIRNNYAMLQPIPSLMVMTFLQCFLLNWVSFILKKLLRQEKKKLKKWEQNVQHLCWIKVQKLWHIRNIHQQQKHSVKFYFNVATMMHQKLVVTISSWWFWSLKILLDHQSVFKVALKYKKSSLELRMKSFKINCFFIFGYIFNVIYLTCVHMKMTLSLYFYSRSSEKMKLLRILFRRIFSDCFFGC